MCNTLFYFMVISMVISLVIPVISDNRRSLLKIQNITFVAGFFFTHEMGAFFTFLK